MATAAHIQIGNTLKFSKMRKIILVLTFCLVGLVTIGQQSYTNKLKPYKYDYSLEKAPFVTRDKLANFVIGEAISGATFLTVYNKTGSQEKAAIWAFATVLATATVKESVIALRNKQRFNYCHFGTMNLGGAAMNICLQLAIDEKFKLSLKKKTASKRAKQYNITTPGEIKTIYFKNSVANK